MSDNLGETGISYTQEKPGRLMRVRGGAVALGELCWVDLAGADTDTSVATVGSKDPGTSDGTTDTGHFAAVRSASVGSPSGDGNVCCIALEAVGDNELGRFAFGTKSDFGIVVDALVEIDTQQVAVGDELCLDSATVTGVGTLTPGGVGTIFAICLETSAAASAGASDLVKVLFRGVAGFGFRQT